jgi:hypothetical protein
MADLLRPHRHFEFYASLELPEVRPVQLDSGNGIALSSSDGSWTRTRRVGHGWEVAQGGPRALWDLAEDAHHRWETLGSPDRSRFGLTVTEDEQTFWLDNPESDLRWPLAAGR